MIERGERSHRTDRHTKTLRHERSLHVRGTLNGPHFDLIPEVDLRSIAPTAERAVTVPRVSSQVSSTASLASDKTSV